MTKANLPPSNDSTGREGERAPAGSLFRVRLILAVVVGGGVGGSLRAALSELEGSWPWPTLVVNLAGAFALGVAVVYGRGRWSPALRAGVSVGVLGALTTFSTVTGEVWWLLDDGRSMAVAWYLAASVFGGVAAAVAGLRLGRSLR